jgi:hypothetical protein
MKNPSPSVEAALLCLHVLFDGNENIHWHDLNAKNTEDFYIKMLRFQEQDIDITHIRKAKQKYMQILQREEKTTDVIFATDHSQYIICKVRQSLISSSRKF